MSGRDDTEEGGWYSVEETAAIFGVSTTAFHNTWRPLVPAADIRDRGRRKLIRVKGLIEAYAQQRVKAELEAKGIDGDLAGNGDSVWLEEFRRHQSRIKKVEADKLEGKVADVDELHRAFAVFLSTIRQGVEAVQRQYGNDAAELVTAPVKRLEEQIDVFAQSKPAAPPAISGDAPGIGNGAGDGAGVGKVPEKPLPAGDAAQDPEHAGVRRARDRAAHGPVRRASLQRKPKSVRKAPPKGN